MAHLFNLHVLVVLALVALDHSDPDKL